MSLPQVSSKELISVLGRAGFTRGKAKRGSHQVFKKGKLTVTVLMGKNPISDGALKACLKRAGISDVKFKQLLHKKTKQP